jgi:hypothetical protein
MPSDDFEDYFGEDIEDDCDCMEADLDILTGIERCVLCGRTRWLNGEEFSQRLKEEAEWNEAYYAEIEKSSQ